MMQHSNDTWNLYEPARQSISAIIFIILRFIRRIISFAWPIILGLMIGRSSGTDRFELAITLIGSLSMITSIIAYFRYYYYIKEEELVIESGLFNRVKLGIPFDRIQTVNFNRTVLHRVFNVVEVEIDTAGSVQSELKIDALKVEKAEELRAFLLSEKAKQTALNTATAEHSDEAPTNQTAQPEELVINLGLGEVLRIGITQNHLRSTGLIFGGLFALSQGVNIEFEDFERILGLGNYTWLGVFMLLALASFLISVVRSGLRYYNLQLWRSDEKYRMEAGLFTRREVSALDHKIQVIQWSDNLLKRLLGYFDVYMKQASSQVVAISRSIAVP
ncbi:MAG: PH domain-containing protein, partial [Bacteroidota bacterium]